MTTSFTYCVIVCVFIHLSLTLSAVVTKGDKCSLQDGSEGKCKFLKECPTVRQLINEGNNTVICGYEGNESIVCCQDGEEVMKTTNIIKKTTPVTIRKPGDISKQKCKEYAEYAYRKIYSPALLLEPHITKKLVCDFQRNRLVVGSSKAARKEFPHMALIGDNNNSIFWICGGSLISENFVLTSASCFSKFNGDVASYVVKVGLTSKSDPEHVQEPGISEIIIHPEYHYPVKYHDIALLRLSNAVHFNSYVRPACLQTEKFIPYVSALASGWGLLSFREQLSNDLLATVLEFYTAERCNDTYTERIIKRTKLKDGILDDFMICAGISKSNRATCLGDGGGPLQVYHQETKDVKCMYDIIGVISFGRLCGIQTDAPDVFTRVSAYIKWIEDIVWPN